MQINEVIKKLKKLSNPKNVEGMARYGINPDKALGITIPKLRKLAKEIGADHQLAQQLWESEIHEARILASMVDDKTKVTDKQLEEWVADFNSWDLCDQTVMNLFSHTSYAWDKAIQWSDRSEEFVKRAGFVTMARLAVSNKDAKDDQFLPFFPIMIRESTDERNFVKKAVNWALRQIGKRNKALNLKAIETCEIIKKIESKTAKWVARNAQKELSSDQVKARL